MLSSYFPPLVPGLQPFADHSIEELLRQSAKAHAEPVVARDGDDDADDAGRHRKCVIS